MNRNLCVALCIGVCCVGFASAQEFQRILFLGNSITLHGPAPSIGWTGNWGMAASAPDKDCAHLITQGLRKKDGTLPAILVKNIAGFERQYTTYDTADLVKESRAFDPDLIVVAIGENVRGLGIDLSKQVKDAGTFNTNQPGAAAKPDAKPLTAAEAKNLSQNHHSQVARPSAAELSTGSGTGSKMLFTNSLLKLLNDIRADRSPTILVRSCFFSDTAKDEALRLACEQVKGTFVSLAGLDKDESHFARSEHPYQHAGVGKHPGDKGMRAIADAVLGALGRAGAAKSPRMKLGAYFFAGWAGKSPFDDGSPEHAWAKGMPTHFTRKLATEFAGRTPVWGWRDDTTELMERQIDLAADHGVSYFSFCWYWHDNKGPINVQAIDQDPKHLPMQLFMKAKNNRRMEFSLLVANHRGAEIVGPQAWRQAADHWITLFKHPCYLRSEGKPVLVIFSPRGADKQGLAYLQEAARKAGFPGVAVAGCGGGTIDEGFQVRTAYNVKPKTMSGQKKSERHSYQELVEANVQAWQAVPGQAFIPVATQGWDRRPWEAPNGEGLGPNGSPVSWYFDKGTPDEFGGMLQRMAAWMEANPAAVTKDRLAIIYAWNEIGEGGWLVPCREDPHGAYLKAVQKAVYGP